MTIDYDSNMDLKRHAIGIAYCYWKIIPILWMSFTVLLICNEI